MSSSERLARKEVELILRRAAEIDTRGTEDLQRRDSDDLDVTDVIRLGEEAGLSPDAVLQALSEVRRGALREEPEPAGALARTLGAGQITVSRVVPAPIESVRRAVDRFLREQLMTIRRHHGDRIEWERAHGIWPGLVRSLDFSKRYAFGLVTRVETLITEERDRMTSVTFQIDVSEMRRERLGQMGLKSAMAFALLGLGGSALFPGFGVYDILALASGSAAAGGIFTLERRRYFESRNRVAVAPERFLDFLVQRYRGRRPAPGSDTDGS